MPETCPNCGKEIKESKQFCTACGASVSPAVPPPEPEEQDASEEDFTPTASTEAPEFTVKTGGRARPQSSAPPKDSVLAIPGLFDKNPRIVNYICYTILVLLVLPFATALIIKLSRGEKLRPSEASIHRRAAIRAKHGKAHSPAAACDIKLVKSTGKITWIPHSGTNASLMNKKSCVPSGSTISTDKKARARVELTRFGIAIDLNSNTTITIKHNPPTEPIPVAATLTVGEIQLDVSPTYPISVSTYKDLTADAYGPGRLHVMSRDKRFWFTSITGGAIAHTDSGNFTLQPGQQLVATPTSAKPDVQYINAQQFAAWTAAWRENYNRPASTAAQSGKPEKDFAANFKDKEQKLIIQALVKSFPRIPPDYVGFEIVANTKNWAIVVEKDTRPDADTLPDFHPTLANLLKKMSGEWTYLEEFEDYSQDLFKSWKQKWGFTKEDEKALGLAQ